MARTKRKYLQFSSSFTNHLPCRNFSYYIFIIRFKLSMVEQTFLCLLKIYIGNLFTDFFYTHIFLLLIFTILVLWVYLREIYQFIMTLIICLLDKGLIRNKFFPAWHSRFSWKWNLWVNKTMKTTETFNKNPWKMCHISYEQIGISRAIFELETSNLHQIGQHI